MFGGSGVEARASFNPHPPLRADAISPAGANRGQTKAVSILTRPYGRMLWPNLGAGGQSHQFQSSPALTGGCYAACGPTWTWTVSFNPHPPLRADAISAEETGTGQAGKFQSSPALTGGCYWPLPPSAPNWTCFNPHPPLRADAMLSPWVGQYGLGVSILTRPYGRMLLLLSPLTLRSSYVSILTRPYGRMLCPRLGGLPMRDTVSILTRPYGRMLCGPTSEPGGSLISFNPHPPLRADAI